MKTLKQLKEERAAIQQESQALLDAATAEDRSLTDDEKVKFTDIEKRFGAVDADIKILEANEARAAHLATESHPAKAPKGADPAKEQRSAFVAFLQNRETPEQRAAISGVEGQVLIPRTIVNMVEIALRDKGGFLDLPNMIITDSANELIIPTLNATDLNAVPTEALESSSQATKKFGSVKLTAHTYRTPIIPIALELLEDAAADVDKILADALASSILSGLNEDVTVGDGASRITGFLKDAPDSGVAATKDSLTYDNLVDLIASVKRPYSSKDKAKMVGNSNTLAAIQKIKDTTGRPIFVQSVVEGGPDRVMGYPYIINEDMPDIGAGNASLAFGDFKKYYLRMVRNIRVIRFTELFMENLAVGIQAFARFDGKLADAGTHPIKVLKHATE